jgi:hypothetical protein
MGMTEKHYAHLSPSYVAATIRTHFPTLGVAGDSAITALRPKTRSDLTGLRSLRNLLLATSERATERQRRADGSGDRLGNARVGQAQGGSHRRLALRRAGRRR